MKLKLRALSALLSVFAVLAVCLPARGSDIAVTAGNVVPSANARVMDCTAGAAISAGQLVYRDATDLDANNNPKVKLADADSATAAARVVYGIAVNTASGAGHSVRICTYDPLLTIGGTTAVNTILILSSTAGGVAPSGDLSQDEYLTVVGVVKVAVSPGKIFFDPTLASGVPQPAS